MTYYLVVHTGHGQTSIEKAGVEPRCAAVRADASPLDEGGGAPDTNPPLSDIRWLCERNTRRGVQFHRSLYPPAVFDVVQEKTGVPGVQ